MTIQTKSRGFTIVELLIVIVIIAILAAITIVAYNGITARANTTSAKSAATNALKKAEAYNADDNGGSGSYPANPDTLTDAASTATYQLAGVTFSDAASAPTTKPTNPNTLLYYTCTGPAGIAVAYYQYDGTPGWTMMYTGGASSSSDCDYVPST